MCRFYTLHVQFLLLSDPLRIFKVQPIMCIIIRYLDVKSFVIGKKLYINSRKFMISIILWPRIIFLIILVHLSCPLIWLLLLFNVLHSLSESVKRRHIFLTRVQNVHNYLSDMSLHIFSSFWNGISLRDKFIIYFENCNTLLCTEGIFLKLDIRLILGLGFY